MKLPPHILVVDDEQPVLVTYSLILEQQGYRITAAPSSEAATAALEQDTFDLLLCDLSLETDHSGFEIIDFARQRQPRLASILLTGYATQEINDQAEKKGITILYKPVEIPKLLATIAHLVKQEPAA